MASVDLKFSRPPNTGSPVNLVFGESEAVDTGWVLTLAATFSALSVTVAADISAPPPKTLTLDATFAPLSVAVSALFDIDIPTWIHTDAGTPWHSATKTDLRTFGDWSDASSLEQTTGTPWREADTSRTRIDAAWRDGDDLEAHGGDTWRDGVRVGETAETPWHQAEVVNPSNTESPWASTVRMPTEFSQLWLDAVDARKSGRLPWASGKLNLGHKALPWHMGALNQGRTRLPWRDGTFVISHGGTSIVIIVVPPVDDACYTPPHGTVPLLFKDAPGDSSLIFHCENHPDPTDPGPGTTVVVPVQKVYIVLNDTHLIRVDGSIELPTLAMQLTLDADSWTWGFSATLPASELANVMPDSDGTPVELAAVINGVTYKMLAESIGRDRSFGVATIKVSGRGKNAMLDVPYAPVQAFGNTADRTLMQLLDDSLMVNGVGIGWSIASSIAEDWLVPAGAWSVQGSHIAAVTGIAAAAGAYVQPHATDDTLIILPRYPSAPWDWASVTPDYELPSSVTTQEGISWVEKARYNRVFVSGQGQGVLGQVTRAGTAGDIVAPMVTDALITAAAAARQRGIPVLADTGRIATVTLRLPVLSATGIIKPGKFVRYVDGATIRFGIVRSTSVDVSSPEVWQSIGVETHE